MNEDKIEEAAEQIEQAFNDILQTIAEICIVIDEHEKELDELKEFIASQDINFEYLGRGKKHGKIH